MNPVNETHPFQVSIWSSGNDNPKSLFEKGHWQEYARCATLPRAEEVALCLSLRHPSGVQIAELSDGKTGGLRWKAIKFLPASASALAS